jgi:hypothetical protein
MMTGVQLVVLVVLLGHVSPQSHVVGADLRQSEDGGERAGCFKCLHVLLVVWLLQCDWGWGVVVSVLRKPPPGQQQQAAAAAANSSSDAAAAVPPPPADAAAYYIVDTLLPCAAGSAAVGKPKPAPIGIPGSSNNSSSSNSNGKEVAARAASGGAADGGARKPELVVLPVALQLVQQISSLRVYLPDDLRPEQARQNLLCVLEVRLVALIVLTAARSAVEDAPLITA